MTFSHVLDLETIWFIIYGNDLGNHMVDVDGNSETMCGT
jgi:hypothetical protein